MFFRKQRKPVIIQTDKQAIISKNRVMNEIEKRKGITVE